MQIGPMWVFRADFDVDFFYASPMELRAEFGAKLFCRGFGADFQLPVED